MIKNNKYNRGDIYYLKMEGGVGSEQKADSPVVIIQNNIGNKYAPTVIIAMVTSREDKNEIPTHVKIHKSCGLRYDSVVLCEQLLTVDKTRLTHKIGIIDADILDEALSISIGIQKEWS